MLATGNTVNLKDLETYFSLITEQEEALEKILDVEENIRLAKETLEEWGDYFSGVTIMHLTRIDDSTSVQMSVEFDLDGKIIESDEGAALI